MSLQKDIEAFRGPFPKKYPENMERAMFEAGAKWATERALNKIDEALAAVPTGLNDFADDLKLRIQGDKP